MPSLELKEKQTEASIAIIKLEFVVIMVIARLSIVRFIDAGSLNIVNFIIGEDTLGVATAIIDIADCIDCTDCTGCIG